MEPSEGLLSVALCRYGLGGEVVGGFAVAFRPSTNRTVWIDMDGRSGPRQ